MTRKILGLLAAVALVAGCELATQTSWVGPDAQCKPAGPALAACVEDSECCSYACVGGLCAEGIAPGAVCRTTDDCGIYVDPVTYASNQLLCKSGHCAVPTPYCRDASDVCGSDLQCCGGNRCTIGRCVLNRAPVIDLGPSPLDDLPRRRLVTLFNATTDPDGDALVFGWTLQTKPMGSTASLSSATARNPTFTPDLVGAYVFQLVATDLPTPSMTSTGTVVLNVINTPPTVAPQADVADGHRNVSPTSSSAVVNDPDGDDIVCTWVVKDPSGAARSTVGPNPCFGAAGVPDDVTTSVPFPTGLLPDDEGTWTVTVSASDGNSTTSADVHVTVTNQPPVADVTRFPYYYANLAAVPADTAPVVLDASVSVDPNGDQLLVPGLTYFWEWVSVSDGGALPTLAGADTATPSFVPTRVADYVLRVAVTDPPSSSRPGATDLLVVTVKVGRHIRQLTHDVIDSAYAKGANKLVMAGHNPADDTKGMIWVLDAATDTEGAGIALVDTTVVPNVHGVPQSVGVTPDGTKAVVVDRNVSIWFVTLGATPTVTRKLAPFTIGDLVVATNRWAYVFNVQWDFALGAFQEIDLNNDSFSIAPWSGGEGYGAPSSSAAANFIYVVDAGGSMSWAKYGIANNQGSGSTTLAWDNGPYCGAYPYVQASEIWPVLGDTFVVSRCGQSYRASDLSAVGTLGVVPEHMDSTTTQALASAGLTLTRFDATLVQTGTETVPPWAYDSFGYTAWITKAWLNSAGTKRYALVYSSSSPGRTGLVIFP